MPGTSKIPSIPRAVTVAIDDLGWLSGSSEKLSGGPSRIGVKRQLELNEYKPLVEVAKTLGIRLPGFFVLMDLDRENVCARYPTTNPTGENFNNAKYNLKLQQSVVDYVISNAAHIEFGLHGIGHEYWKEGERVRAEWYNQRDDHPWDQDIMRDHVKCATEILAQYGLSPANGHSFPEHFVPCAYGYHWNPQGESSTGIILGEAGVKYAHTMFSEIESQNPPIQEGGGFDHQMLVLDRHIYGIPWYKLSAIPEIPETGLTSDLIESHWANWLAQDDFLQEKVTHRWKQFFRTVQKLPGYYLAKNSEQLYSQWLYLRYTAINCHDSGKFVLDNSLMPEQVYEKQHLSNLVLRLPVGEGEHVSNVLINGKQIPAYYECEGNAYLYLPRLNRQPYVFEYTFGAELPYCVIHQGSANIYDLHVSENKTIIDLKIYGEQEVQVRLQKTPISIEADTPRLNITLSEYDAESGVLTLQIKGINYQGERGKIIVGTA